MYDRIKNIVDRQYPITKDMCEQKRTQTRHLREIRIKRLLEELKDLTVEQQLFTLKQWEDEK
jgi:hypothetical protein